MRVSRKAFLFLAVSALSLPAQVSCADWVREDVIRLGQTADMSGSRAANSKEFNAGAVANFESVNKHGGVFGRRIELVVRDDAYQVDRSVANATELIEKQNVFLIFSMVGTENFKAVEEKVTTPAKVPLFAPSSGADLLRLPYKRYVFPVRAGYHAEMEEVIQHLATVGVSRVSVFCDDDSFGKDILVGVERAAARHDMKVQSVASADREGKMVDEAVKKIGPTRPRTVIVGSAGSSASKFVREMLKYGYPIQFYFNSGIGMKRDQARRRPPRRWKAMSLRRSSSRGSREPART